MDLPHPQPSMISTQVRDHVLRHGDYRSVPYPQMHNAGAALPFAVLAFPDPSPRTYPGETASDPCIFMTGATDIEVPKVTFEIGAGNRQTIANA